tara:strand:+ start:387 stop:521 length:135 start_codon:yes stop_codon:yes gene_type:complete
MYNFKSKLIDFWLYIRRPYDKYMLMKKYKKRLKELKEQDPFIYE